MPRNLPFDATTRFSYVLFPNIIRLLFSTCSFRISLSRASSGRFFYSMYTSIFMPSYTTCRDPFFSRFRRSRTCSIAAKVSESESRHHSRVRGLFHRPDESTASRRRCSLPVGGQGGSPKRRRNCYRSTKATN